MDKNALGKSKLNKLFEKLAISKELDFLYNNASAYEGTLTMLEQIIYNGNLNSELKESLVEELFKKHQNNDSFSQETTVPILQSDLGKASWNYLVNPTKLDHVIDEKSELELNALRSIVHSTFKIYGVLKNIK